MKICWDNLENIYLNKNGNFTKNKISYYLKVCYVCNEEYLGRKNEKYCSLSCYNKNRKKHAEETKEKISKSNKGKKRTQEVKNKLSKIHMGNSHTEETKRKISESNKGHKCTEKTRKKISNANEGRKHTDKTKEKISNNRKGKCINENNVNWKGGIVKKNICSYNYYFKLLDSIEECKETKEGYLQVKCKTCNKWFIPNRNQVQNRVQYLKGNYISEHNFYCSQKCKYSCSVYGQIKYPKNYKPYIDREVQSELREMILKRDEYQCIKCGEINNLQCHHIEGIKYNPLESSDIDLCITLCKECHKKIHSEEGCKYNELKCK